MKILRRIIVILVIASLFLSVDALITWLYHYRFEHFVLPNNPSMDFKYAYNENDYRFDRNFLNITIVVLAVILAGILWTQEKFETLKSVGKEIPKYMLTRIFLLRVIFYTFLLVPIMMFSTIILDNISGGNDDKILVYILMFAMVNSVALIPYLALKGIVKIFTFKDVIFFNLGMALVFFVAIKLGLKQYSAIAISGFVSGLPFVAKLISKFSQVSDFLEISNKNIFEMGNAGSFELYPQSNAETNTTNAVDQDIIYYVPKSRANQLMFPVGMIAVVFGLFLFSGSGDLSFILFNGIPCFLALFCMYKIYVNGRKTQLLKLSKTELTILEINYTTPNAFGLIYRIYLNPKYKTIDYRDIQRINIQNNPMQGQLLVLDLKNGESWGIFFYYDDKITAHFLYEQISKYAEIKK